MVKSELGRVRARSDGAGSSGRARTAGDAALIDEMAGRCVRQLREQRGLSRSALGAACGVSGQQVDKYESGVNRMSLSRFAQIAGALGTDPMRLLSLATERSETHIPPLPERGTSPARQATTASQRIKAAELMRLGLDMEEPLLDHVLALAKAAAR